MSSSANNVNTRSATKPTDNSLLKTHSASNVFTRTSLNSDRNSLDLIDNNNTSSTSPQYVVSKQKNISDNYSNLHFLNKELRSTKPNKNGGSNNNPNKYHVVSNNNNNKGAFVGDYSDRKNAKFVLRRGSSVENINSSVTDLNVNGSLKKIKYENEVSLIF